MAKDRNKPADESERVFKQESDPLGRLRLDRPFTPQEAMEQDREHRERYVEERRKRFLAPEASE